MATPSPSLTNMPLEIFHGITQYLGNRDRRSLRLASRACAREGLQTILHEVHVEPSTQSLAHLSVLSQIPGFARYVQRIVFAYPGSSRRLLQEYWHARFRRAITKAHAVATRHSIELRKTPSFKAGFLDRFVDPLSGDSSRIAFYGGDAQEREKLINILISAFRRFPNLAQISIDSEDQLFEWTLPNPQFAHVWLRSQGSPHPSYHDFLWCIQKCCSVKIKHLIVRPDEGQLRDSTTSFRAFTSNIRDFVTKIERLEIRMPGVELTSSELGLDSKDKLIEAYEALSNFNAVAAYEVLFRAKRLQELDLRLLPTIPKLLQSPLMHGGSFPCYPSIGSFETLRFPCLRRLSLGSFSASESQLMAFFRKQRRTLRHLTLTNAQICAGTWASCLERIREVLNLESAVIRESLCEPSTRTLLKFGASSSSADDYKYFVKQKVVVGTNFGDRLGEICTIDTPLNSEVRSSTLSLLKKIFAQERKMDRALPPACTGGRS